MLNDKISIDSLIKDFLLSLRVLPILLGFCILFLKPFSAHGELLINNADENDGGMPIARSLETLRDLDYQSWKIVAYRESFSKDEIVLRIVSFPGKLRLDHPTDLIVQAGRREWILRDITLENTLLASDGRQAAAEFDLLPLLTELTNNRPLRLELPNAFNELPVPPYLVKEWRSLMELSEN